MRVAGAVFTLLALLSSVTRPDRRALVGRAGRVADARVSRRQRARSRPSLVRIMFPGVGLLVLSAWCLGVLNSHRRFFLSYVSPAMWNLAIIAAVMFGRRSSAR